jgi:predicted ArsR family transcriptional regulator
MAIYTADVERMMKRLFDSLNESGRRRYAAIEVAKLGHGGIEYVARILDCDPKTIRRGLEELEGRDDLDTGRTRKKGVDANL